MVSLLLGETPIKILTDKAYFRNLLEYVVLPEDTLKV